MTKTLKKSLALILSVIMLMSVMPMSLSLAATEDGFVYEVEDEKPLLSVTTEVKLILLSLKLLVGIRLWLSVL